MSGSACVCLCVCRQCYDLITTPSEALAYVCGPTLSDTSSATGYKLHHIYSMILLVRSLGRIWAPHRVLLSSESRLELDSCRNH